MKRWILGLLTLAMMTLPGADTRAGTPDNGTLTDTVTVLNYTAGPFLVSNPTGVNGDPPVCLPETCDDYTLTVNLPANYQASNPDERVVIQIAWANANTDFDVYVLENGQEKTDAATSNNPEVIVLPAESAVYTIRVVAFAVAGDTFNGTITLGTPTSAGTGVGVYQVSDDVFTCNTHLTGQEGIFSHDGDAEPGVKFTPDGVAWVGSNAGLGAGIGLWRISDICAQDFTFLGSPDAGAGGGDVDIVVATEPNINGFYNIYTSSLTLANVTSSVSMDGGATFIPTVVSDVTPINDRQWNAAYGAGTVYLSYRSLNTGNELFVVRSDANGLPGTFVGPFLVYADVVVDAALATQLGNMVCDRRPGANTPVASGPNGEGNVYHGFVLQGNKVYVAVSKDFGVTWSSKLVFEGPLTDAYDHNFTWVAVDDAGNVYTCFSDGNDCFYAVSQDQGDTWSQPIRINSGADTKSSVFPEMAAGSAGQVAFTFYGSPAPGGPADPTNAWHVFHARCDNALDATPVFEQVRVSDHVIKYGEICLNGINCNGNRELLENFEIDIDPTDGSSFITYTDAAQTGGTYITRQIAGKSAIQGLSVVDRSNVCPNLENNCVSSPPPEGRCLKPGDTLITDPSGDTSALGTPQQDILSVGIMEPFFSLTAEKTVWVMRVAELDPANLPLNATYYILFDTPDGITRWVAMETCDVTASPSFGYGTLDETLGFQREGDAEAGEVFADGTICITIDNSLIGGVGQGDVINNIHGDVRVFAGALCSGLVSQVDETASVSDTLRGNQECGPTPVFVSSFDFHETGQSVALDWNAVSTDMFTHFNIRRSHNVLSGWETVNSSPIMIDGPGHYTFHDFPEEVRTTYYRLMGVTRQGEEILLKDLRADLSGGARGFALAMAGQNPFRGAARISYTVPEDRHVRVEVFSINGQRVKTLVNDTVGAGTHSVTFDMESDYGRRLPAGVYLVRVQSGNWNQAMQIVAID